MTMQSHPELDAAETQALRTEVLKPVQRPAGTPNAVRACGATACDATACDATEKLAVVTPVTEKLNPVPAIPAIPAQRQDSRPAAAASEVPPAPVAAQPRPRWEHFPIERHPAQAAPEQRRATPQQPPATPRPPAPRQPATAHQPATAQRPATPTAQSAPRPAPRQPRWELSALATAPRRSTLAVAGFAACDYLIRTVSILGLLAVVGMVTAGTSGTHTQQEAQTPGTTVATAPTHPGAFTSTHHRN